MDRTKGSVSHQTFENLRTRRTHFITSPGDTEFLEGQEMEFTDAEDGRKSILVRVVQRTKTDSVRAMAEGLGDQLGSLMPEKDVEGVVTHYEGLGEEYNGRIRESGLNLYRVELTS